MSSDDSVLRALSDLDGDLPKPTETEDFSARCEQLFREHNEALVGLLNAKLHSRVGARDVAQEAYVRLFQLDEAGAISHLRGRLFKAALNIATDRLRERARRARDDHLVFFNSRPVDGLCADSLSIVARPIDPGFNPISGPPGEALMYQHLAEAACVKDLEDG